MCVITVFIKPRCVQCNATKRYLDDAAVPYITEDLTAPENAKQLDNFKALGFLSAPITEYAGFAVPGFNPDGLDQIIAAYKGES